MTKNEGSVPAKKTFIYQFGVDAVPYNPDTVEYCYGEEASYNADYPEDVFGREIAFEMIKDAICYVLEAKMNFLVEHKVEVSKLEGQAKAFWEYLQEKEDNYRLIEKSIKKKLRNCHDEE